MYCITSLKDIGAARCRLYVRCQHHGNITEIIYSTFSRPISSRVTMNLVSVIVTSRLFYKFISRPTRNPHASGGCNLQFTTFDGIHIEYLLGLITTISIAVKDDVTLRE